MIFAYVVVIYPEETDLSLNFHNSVLETASCGSQLLGQRLDESDTDLNMSNITSQSAATCNHGQRIDPPGSRETGPLSLGGNSPIVGQGKKGRGFLLAACGLKEKRPQDILVQGTSTMDRITLQNDEVPSLHGLPTTRRHVC
uniref:Uncharacterized protein n=1 Tax=Hyaloperonospora arabidopsidis (strain Emoy2) TaxID=559515 RepID=M4B6H8_HYAAE